MTSDSAIKHDTEQRHHAILDIVNKPGHDAAQYHLAQLQLDGVPSREQIFKDIEERILLPKRSLPDHWLPTYQMYVLSSTSQAENLHCVQSLGTLSINPVIDHSPAIRSSHNLVVRPSRTRWTRNWVC